MAFAPIALIIPQYENYPNNWLKAYDQGTTTPLSMATDANGGTLLVKVQLDIQGFPITAGNARFIPFIDGNYDLWLFPTSSEADANDTTNAIQFADNLNTTIPDSNVSYTVSSKLEANALTLINGRKVFITSDDGGEFTMRTGAAVGTYNDDGGSYAGTKFTTGDGSSGISRDYSGDINTAWGGVSAGMADNYTAITTMLTLAIALNKKLYIPAGTYTYGTTLDFPDSLYVYGDGKNITTLSYTGVEDAANVGSLSFISSLRFVGTSTANNGVVIGNSSGLLSLKAQISFEDFTVTGFKRQGQVSAVNTSLGGSGYDGTTTVTFSASSGVTATGTPIVSGGQLVGIDITNRGSGYVTAPTVSTGGAGSGAYINAYIGGTGLVFRAAVTGSVRNSKIADNWRNFLAMQGPLNTTWVFDTTVLGTTKGALGYWDGGIGVHIEGLQSSKFTNCIVDATGEEGIYIKSKWVQNVTFDHTYYEIPNLSIRGACVLLTGSSDANIGSPFHVNFEYDLIGFQPLYPLPTVNGFGTSSLISMTEWVYRFDYANWCKISNPAFKSENYYDTIYVGANVVACEFISVFASEIHNQSLAQVTQGMMVSSAKKNSATPLTLKGLSYTTTGGLVRAVNSATPSVSSNNVYYQFANTSSTTVTDFLDSHEGQRLVITFAEQFTYLSGANFSMGSRGNNNIDVVEFVKSGGVWKEISRLRRGETGANVAGSGTSIFSTDGDKTKVILVTISGAINDSAMFALKGTSNTTTLLTTSSNFSTVYNNAGTVNVAYQSGAYRGYNYTSSTLEINVRVLV